MKLKFTLLAFLCYALISAQNFNEVELPAPEFLNPFFIGPLLKSTIHYGKKPANYNGKVIVFNHGYIDLNQSQFLFDNSFYKRTYEQGYQAVFVATTRGKGIWVNGELLAEAIDIVTDRYNVSQVTLVAHSNGGKASEAAMIHYGKNEKVSQAFALGTPFWGTYLANISQLPFLNWAWNLTGLNEGARTSTTYYCRDVVRPYLDNHPNNQPNKFIVLGASGFYKGSTIAAPAFLLTGGVLLPVQGANDGVAAYSSTLRPGAEYVFRKNDSRAIFDHLDVSLGQFSWSYVQSYIENRSLQSNITDRIIDQNITSSDYYLIHSANEYNPIVLDKDTDRATIEILHKESSKPFKILKNKKPLQQDFLSEGHRTMIEVSESELSLESDSKFVAFVRPNNDITMLLEKQDVYHNPLLKVTFESEKSKISTSDITVTGILTKTAEIDGTASANESEVIVFSNKNNSFYFDTSNLQDGVYSLLLNAESEGFFKRSLISGFVVGNVKEALDLSTIQEEKPEVLEKNIQLFPTIVKDQATLSLVSKNISRIKANLYTLTGRTVKSFEIDSKHANNIDISNQIKGLQRGIYLLEIQGIGTIKFIKH